MKKAKNKANNRHRQRKLRILFVSEYFYPRAAGGEIWSWELCTELAARGHEVTVIACRHDKSPPAERARGVRIIRPVKAGSERVTRKIAAMRLVSYVKRHIETHRGIDVIHTMAYAVSAGVSALARRHGIPCVTSVHSYFGRDWRRIASTGGFIQWYERKTLKDDKSSVIHVPSEYLRRRIRQDTGKDSMVIHNWVTDKFPDERPMPKRTLLFVGSLEPVKNPLACLKAAKARNARLVVIGSGSLEDEMRERAIQERVNVIFLNDVKREDTLGYIGGASLVLVPSVTESFSLVALEAVAQGTPVSGTPVGILPELPGIIPFPPKRIPERLPEGIKKAIRRKFSRAAAIKRFEATYLAILAH